MWIALSKKSAGAIATAIGAAIAIIVIGTATGIIGISIGRTITAATGTTIILATTVDRASGFTSVSSNYFHLGSDGREHSACGRFRLAPIGADRATDCFPRSTRAHLPIH